VLHGSPILTKCSNQSYQNYKILLHLIITNSNPHYEIDFRVCSAYGAANPKINFLKVESKRHFQKIDFYNENCWITKVGAALRAAPTFWSDRTQVNIKLT